MRPGLAVLILGGLASVVAAPPCRAQVPSTSLANCSWRASDGAHFTVHGNDLELRVSALTRPEPRTIECWAALPGNREMVVTGLHHGAVTEAGWTFAFEREDGARLELYRGTLERIFAFPVPLRWEHRRRIGVMIGIPGDNPGYLRLRDLRLEPAATGIPAAPRPESPADGEEVTPAAADFFWSYPDPDLAAGYELEWRRGEGKPERERKATYFLTDARGSWPAKWLAPGAYTWRVRAFNPVGEEGPWSPALYFTVRAAAASRAPDLVPSAERPVFLIAEASDDPASDWKRLPEDARARLLFRMGGPPDRVESILAAAQQAGIPVALQVNGPHDIIGGRWDRLPLARLAHWAGRYPAIKAFYICEQAVQGGVANPEVKSYLERLIALGAEQGRPVFWADANWGCNVWLDVEAQKGFSRYLRAHRGFIYPLWKMNGGDEPYLAPAGLLGLWLTNTVAAWGVQPESYYWTEAGFRTLGVQDAYKEGVRQDAPPVIFQQLALLGASAGAEVYSFEPGVDLLTANSGQNIDGILVPLIRMLSDHSVVPTLHRVRSATVEEHSLRPSDLDFRVGYTTPIEHLFANTLGLAYPFEMVPESGNCYWIPFLPPAESAARLDQPAAYRSSSMRTCRLPAPGQAAVFRTEQTAFVLNSRVNWPEEQAFSLTLARTQVTGKLGLNGWVVAKGENHDEADFWFFARTGASVTMDFNQPVRWKPAPDDHGANQSKSEGAADWSTPVTHLELRAEAHPWHVVIRRNSN